MAEFSSPKNLMIDYVDPSSQLRVGGSSYKLKPTTELGIDSQDSFSHVLQTRYQGCNRAKALQPWYQGAQSPASAWRYEDTPSETSTSPLQPTYHIFPKYL